MRSPARRRFLEYSIIGLGAVALVGATQYLYTQPSETTTTVSTSTTSVQSEIASKTTRTTSSAISSAPSTIGIPQCNVQECLLEIEAEYPSLAAELRMLPELQSNDVDALALRRLTWLTLVSNQNPELRNALEAIMSEGIRKRRKYCAPLQALLWHCEGNDPSEHNPLQSFYLGSFIRFAWAPTYDTDRWRPFDQVVDRLNSPLLVSTYMLGNIRYEKHGAELGHFRAKQVFRMKSGPCSWQAAFAFHCLNANGYEYDEFEANESDVACILAAYEGSQPGMTWDGPGHVTCLFKQRGVFYLIDNGRMEGPYNGVEEAATGTWRSWDYYEFYNYKYQSDSAYMTKRVKRQ